MTYKIKTPEQQKNYLNLLEGLVMMYGDRHTDSHFKMGCYQIDGRGCYVQEPKDAFTRHNCGTSACVLGHGPIFGITGDGLIRDWLLYAEKFFGAGAGEWAFLFSSAWSDDIQEAIARLKMYINGFNPRIEEWRYSYLYAGREWI